MFECLPRLLQLFETTEEVVGENAEGSAVTTTKCFDTGGNFHGLLLSEASLNFEEAVIESGVFVTARFGEVFNRTECVLVDSFDFVLYLRPFLGQLHHVLFIVVRPRRLCLLRVFLRFLHELQSQVKQMFSDRLGDVGLVEDLQHAQNLTPIDNLIVHTRYLELSGQVIKEILVCDRTALCLLNLIRLLPVGLDGSPSPCTATHTPCNYELILLGLT